jgi:hypothetical protein
MTTRLVPTIDWRPAEAARIDPVPYVPRTFGQSTMSDEDYAKAQEAARNGDAPSGVLRDWGSLPPETPETPA